MELSIDTSTKTAGVALSQDGRVLAEMAWRAEFSHTTQLLPTIDLLLERAKGSPKDIRAVFVAVGPGSFSGLRVGLGAAKGFALSLDVPLVCIGTLEVEAYPHLHAGFPICPVLDVGRGEVATALFVAEGGVFKKVVEEHITTPEGLCSMAKGKTLFCGEDLPMVAELLKQRLGEAAVLPSMAALLRRPGFLAEMGWHKLRLGEKSDITTVQPLYLRKPSITQPARP